jgi:hypothetical protein
MNGRSVVLVTLDGTIAHKADFDKVMGTAETVTFWSGDAVGNVNYSWTFDGKTLSEVPADLDLGMSMARVASGKLGEITQSKNCLYLSFNHSGALPGAATVYVRTGDVYPDGTSLNLYDYDESSGTLAQLSSGNVVSHGYVSFTIAHCSVLVLSPAALAAAAGSQTTAEGGIGGLAVGLIALAVVIVLAGIAVLVSRLVARERRSATRKDGAA